jgi:hypothetical protein
MLTPSHHRRVNVTTTLTPLTIQRLAYVRYLYQEGIEHSRRPSPLSASALLSFHDAVENLLGLAAEHLDVDVKPATTFLGYWEAIRPKYDLPGKANMRRLNDNRVALKHGGTFPSPQAIEQARTTVVDFFRIVVPAVFDLDFDKIDMVGLVTIEKVAQTLRDAQTHADVGDIPTALAGLNAAFRELLAHCAGPAFASEWGRSPFRFGGDLPHFSPFGYGSFGRESWATPMIDHKKQIEALREAVPTLRRALQVIGLGIDYAKYARFEILTPQIRGYADGQQWFVVTAWHRSLTPEDYDSCRNFVIESALIAAGADDVLALREEEGQVGGEHESHVWPGPAQQPE